MEEGYIKLCRKLAAWEWYTDANTVRVFIHCLIMANWKVYLVHGNIGRMCWAASRSRPLWAAMPACS